MGYITREPRLGLIAFFFLYSNSLFAVSNGQLANDWYYDALVQNDGGCSGTLIDDRFVLTAAHCLGASAEEDLALVTFKQVLPASGGYRRDITVQGRRYYHPTYFSSNSGANDIGMIALDQPASETVNVLPIPAKLYGAPSVGDVHTLAGIGAHGPNCSMPGGVVKTKATLALNEINLMASIAGVPEKTEGMLFNYRNSFYHTCPGDSGGHALVSEGGGKKIVGVVSSGTPTSSQIHPVFIVANWIKWVMDGRPDWYTLYEGSGNLSGGNWNYFGPMNAAQMEKLSVKLKSVSGDLDLYLKVGGIPTFNDYDCKSALWPHENNGIDECTLSPDIAYLLENEGQNYPSHENETTPASITIGVYAYSTGQYNLDYKYLFE